MSTLYVNTIAPQSGDTVGIDGKLVVSGSIELGDGATDITSFVGQLTASNGMVVTNHITADDGVVTVSSDLTASNGLLIPDDTLLRFGTGAGDVTMEYDEDGTDTLLINGNVTVVDDKKLYFGTGQDASIEYDENGTDELRFAGAAVTFEQDATFDNNVTLGVAATDITTVTGKFTGSNGLEITGDATFTQNVKVQGDLQVEGTINAITHHETDLYIQDKTITISSGSNEANTDGAGINFGGSSDTPIATFLFEADSLGSTSHHLVSSTGLKVTGDFQATTNITASEGLLISNHITAGDGVTTINSDLTASNGLLIPDDTTIRFGTGADATIEYDENGTDELRFAGAAVTFEQAVTFDGNVTLGADENDVITTSGELTASLGISIPDDKKLYFGTGFDASFEYDEDGTDTLLYAGSSIRISDDTKLEFGTGGDASIEYDENGTDELRFAGAAVTFEQAVTFDGNMTLGDAATDTVEVQGVLTASADAIVADDKKVYFGTGKDASIEYDEDGTDELRFAGAAATFEQDVTFDNDVTLGVAVTDVTTVTGQLTASNGMVVTDHITATDGTTTISSILAANGAVTLGNATGDDITITGRIAADIDPKTDNTYDLGAASLQWKDLYVHGIGYIDQLGTDGDPVSVYVNAGEIDGAVIGGESAAAATFTTLNANGTVTLGDAASDVTTVTGKLTGSNGLSVTGDATFTQNVTVQGDLDVRGVVNTTTNHETELHIADKAIIIGSGSSKNDGAAALSALDQAGIYVGATGSLAVASIVWDTGTDSWHTPEAFSVSGSLTVNGAATLGDAATDVTTVTGHLTASNGMVVTNHITATDGTTTITNLAATTADINAGNIDNTAIGASTQSTAKFTTLSASSTLHVVGATTLEGGATVNGNATFDNNLTTNGILSGTTLHARNAVFGGTDQDHVAVTGSFSLHNELYGYDNMIYDAGEDALKFNGTTYFNYNTILGDDVTDTVEVQGVLTASADVIVADDKKVYFGTGKDASIEYDEDGTDELRFAGAAVTFEQAVTFDGNTILGNHETDTVEIQGVLTASADAIVADDKRVYFGTGKDASIEYDEDGTDELRFAGAAVTFEQAVTFQASVTASQGILIPDDQYLRFGDASDVTIEYDEDGNDVLTFEAGKNGAHALLVKNTTAGTSANARIQVQADGGAGLNISAYDDGNSNAEYADKGVLFSDTGASALAIMGRGNNVEIYRSSGGTPASADKKMVIDADSKISLSNNDAGTSNTVLGKSAGASLASGGNYNLIVGEYAGGYLTTGDNNSLMGYNAGGALTTGSNNVAIGYSALASEQGGSGSIAIGNYALYSQNVSGSGIAENGNVAIGDLAGYHITTGSQNVAMGTNAMYMNSRQHGCIAVGAYSLYNMKNEGWDYDDVAGRAGAGNTAVGEYAGYQMTTGLHNTLIGSRAGEGAWGGSTTGHYNVFVGSNAGTYINGYATNNVLIGAYAGSDWMGDQDQLTTGDYNIMIGNLSDFSDSDAQYQIVIGNGIVGTGNNDFSFGKASNIVTNDFDADAAWSRSSDVRKKRNIQDDGLGLEFINKLRTVTHQWKPSTELPKEWDEYSEENNMNLDITIHGMIAQEVKQALDEVECETFGGWKERSDGMQTLSREMFVTPLIKAVQELSSTVKEQQDQIEELKDLVNKLVSK